MGIATDCYWGIVIRSTKPPIAYCIGESRIAGHAGAFVEDSSAELRRTFAYRAALSRGYVDRVTKVEHNGTERPKVQFGVGEPPRSYNSRGVVSPHRGRLTLRSAWASRVRKGQLGRNDRCLRSTGRATKPYLRNSGVVGSFLVLLNFPILLDHFLYRQPDRHMQLWQQVNH